MLPSMETSALEGVLSLQHRRKPARLTHSDHGRPCGLQRSITGTVSGATQTIMQDATHCDFQFKHRK